MEITETVQLAIPIELKQLLNSLKLHLTFCELAELDVASAAAFVIE